MLVKELRMSPRFHADQHPIFGRVTLRIYSGWLLCALVVLFCASARSDNYDAGRHGLRVSTQRAIIGAGKARRDHPRATLLELFCLAAGWTLLLGTAKESLQCGTAQAEYCYGGFDPERYLRPPPRG
jgi:hypothetical protein